MMYHGHSMCTMCATEVRQHLAHGQAKQLTGVGACASAESILADDDDCECTSFCNRFPLKLTSPPATVAGLFPPMQAPCMQTSYEHRHYSHTCADSIRYAGQSALHVLQPLCIFQ